MRNQMSESVRQNDMYLEMLQQILDGQEAQKEAFEEFRDEILEKLDNLSLPGGNFGVEDL